MNSQNILHDYQRTLWFEGQYLSDVLASFFLSVLISSRFSVPLIIHSIIQ